MEQSRLPLFLREGYRLCQTKIFGQNCLLAVEKDNREPRSPGEYAAHAKILSGKLGQPVTLVIPRATSSTRNRMVRAGTPFIVPGSQLFMPFLMADLRERFTAPGPDTGQPFTPAAQCILIYHLLRQSLQGLPLREIAKLTGYSAMMVTRVKDEWESNALCQTTKVARSVVIEFTATGRELWDKALLLFTSPAKKSHWIRWSHPAPAALVAGYTALSRSTMMEDDPVPTWAVHRDPFRSLLKKGAFHLADTPEEANARLEEWSYSPALLSNGPTVDPLSLFLTLRGDPDDRVQQQLQTVLDSAFSS